MVTRLVEAIAAGRIASASINRMLIVRRLLDAKSIVPGPPTAL
jgi:hypothetical protein